MRQYIDTLQDVQGNALVGATILVQNYLGGANASIYSDNGLTPIANSTVSTGTDGQFSFFVADGNYNLVMSKNATVFKTQSPVSIFDGAPQVTFPDTGSANAYAVTNSTLEKALRAGLRASFHAANANTGASTFQYNGLTVKNIVQAGGAALIGGMILANGIYAIEYDGASWEIKNASFPSTNGQTAAEIAAGVTPTNFGYAELDPRRYGFTGNGVANDYPSIHSALLVAGEYSSARVTLPQNSNVVCNSGLNYNCNGIILDLNGSTVSFAGVASGPCIQFSPTNSNANTSGLQNGSHPLMNGRLIGPGVTVTAVTGISISNANPLNFLSFRNLGMQDFSNDVTFAGANVYEICFDHCQFTLTSGTPSAYSIISSSTNLGERILFHDCAWYNRNLIVTILNGSTDMHFEGCSWDFMSRAVTMQSGGRIFFNNGHIETPNDTDWIALIEGSYLSISNSDILLDANKTVYDYFFSQAGANAVTGTNGGISIRDCFFGPGANNMTTRLIGGFGNARVDNVVLQNGGIRPVIAQALNNLAWGNFSSTNYTDEWTLSNTAGSTPPVRSAAQAHSFGAAYNAGTAYVPTNIVSSSGSYYICIAPTTGNAPPNGTYWDWYGYVSADSLSFPGSATNYPLAIASIPCKPGQLLCGELWYMVAAIAGTGGALIVNLDYLDKAGTVIFSFNFDNITANAASFTRLPLYTLVPAPFGTVSARLYLSLQNMTSGTPNPYVADVVLNCQ